MIATDAPSPTRTDGLIDPTQFPGLQLVPDTISTAATDLTDAGTIISDQGAAIVSKWSGLPQLYQAPESQQLFDILAPVSDDTTVISTALAEIGSALAEFAEAAAPIQRALKEIHGRAVTFHDKALGGTTVSYWDTDNPRFDNGDIAAAIDFMNRPIGDYPDAHIAWDKYTPWIEENKKLVGEVNAQAALLDAARVECVNRINRIRKDAVVPLETAVTKAQLDNSGMSLPWGTQTDGDRSCYESFNDGLVQSFTGAWEGILALGGHDSMNDTQSWQNAGDAWAGLATSLGAVLLMGPAVPLVTAFAPKGSWEQTAAAAVFNKQVQVIEGLVGDPQSWIDNPSKASGNVVGNVGTFFIPVGGIVSGVLKTGVLGARIASLAERAGSITGLGKLAIDGAKAAKIAKLFDKFTDSIATLKYSEDGSIGAGSAAKLQASMDALDKALDDAGIAKNGPSTLPDATGRIATDPYAPNPVHPGFDTPTRPEMGSADGGEGYWKDTNHNAKDETWVRYQEQIAGTADAPAKHVAEYYVPRKGAPDLDFDGHVWRGDPPQEVFLEAKQGRDFFESDGKSFLTKIDLSKFVKQAQRQLDAMDSAGSDGRLEWHMSNETAANKTREAFTAAGLGDDVDVYYTPAN